VTAAGVSVSVLSKTFPGAVSPALSSLSLQLAPGTLTALLGPSGCGKTTTLRIIAGLLAPDAGDVRIGDRPVLPVAPEEREVGMVFQRPLLFPHLDVAGNVAFGLRMRGASRRRRAQQTAAMLDLVQLGGYGGRRVGQLSGGQQQRVALARALVTAPRVLLLDEPFSQLDATLRGQMREMLRDVQLQVGVTTLLVTHDQQEAVELADRIALLVDGRLEQHGTPRDFYERPATLASARFFGARNLIPGVVRDGHLDCELGRLDVAAHQPQGPATLVVRPESLRLTASVEDGTVHGRVTAADYRGTRIDVTVTVGSTRLLVSAPASEPVAVGALTGVHIPETACTVISTCPPHNG